MTRLLRVLGPAALLAAGCVGPASHPSTDPRWLVPGTDRASVALAPLPSRPLRVAVYGDSRGDRAAHRRVVEALRGEHPDLVVFTGDALQCTPVGHLPDLGVLGYLLPFWPQHIRGYPLFSLTTLLPFPQLLHETLLSPFHPVRDPDGWNGFLADTAPLRLQDRVPFVFVPGNHDLYHAFDRAAVATLFGAPGGDGGQDPQALWFALDLGRVRLVVLDTGADLLGDGDPAAPGGAQLQWCERELAAAAAAGRQPVVLFHRPACSSAAEDPIDPEIRDGIGALLQRRGVRLALSGHAHAYERLERPCAGGTTTFVVTGGAGAPFHHEEPEGARDPGSRAFVEERLHYVLLEIGDDGIRGRAVAVPGKGEAGPGQQLDAFVIAR